MSKKYLYFAKKRMSPMYARASDIKICKLKTSHCYTTCHCFQKHIGRTRELQQQHERRSHG